MVNAAYFRGVGVGLLIAWVTGAIAYLIPKGKTTPTILRDLVILEFVISVIMFAVGYLI